MLPTPDVVGIISVCGLVLETALVEYTSSSDLIAAKSVGILFDAREWPLWCVDRLEAHRVNSHYRQKITLTSDHPVIYNVIMLLA